MRRTSARVSLLVIASLMTFAYARAQSAPDPWYGRQANPKNIDPPKTFPGMFSIELPKNWQLAPGHTGTIFATVEKTGRFEPGALITIEYPASAGSPRTGANRWSERPGTEGTASPRAERQRVHGRGEKGVPGPVHRDSIQPPGALGDRRSRGPVFVPDRHHDVPADLYRACRGDRESTGPCSRT